ncbi:MAG: heparan-alpha-glucosaminide N-acetyltransferase domain-containing protein [Sphingomicrobium sp.]
MASQRTDLRPKPVADAKGQRLVSLDLLRGLAVAGMILVNEMAGMESQGPVYPTLLHSSWAGLTLADWVFPAFLMMVGVSVPLSLGDRAAAGLAAGEAKRIVWRSLRLILLGFVLSNLWWFSDFSATTWRLFGVLQRIGLVYGACAFLFLLCGPRTRLLIIAATLLLYWPLCLIPSLDGMPNDIWVRGHNFVASVDRVLLGSHVYVKGPDGYDPEGLLGTLPAVAHGLIGVAIGEFLQRRQPASLRTLAVGGLAMLVAGCLWSLLFPVVKDIWSSSFVLVSCGITTLLLAGLHLAFDDGRAIAGWRKIVAVILLPFGVNAIAAYVLHDIAGGMLGWDLFLQPYREARALLTPEFAALVPVTLFIAFIWLCVAYLWRRNWVIKI